MCNLPLVNPTKVCRQNVTRYYYDERSASCREFSYSGCLGNGNNFETLNDCEKKCKIQLLFGWFDISHFRIEEELNENNRSFTIEQCSFIPDKGPCRGEFDRWYFDSKSGLCRTFKYGGCMKNKNNHISESDCIDTCVKPKQKSKIKRILLF